jgi:hypothetical protein
VKKSLADECDIIESPFKAGESEEKADSDEKSINNSSDNNIEVNDGAMKMNTAKADANDDTKLKVIVRMAARMTIRSISQRRCCIN